MEKILVVDDCLETTFLIEKHLRKYELFFAKNIAEANKISEKEEISLFLIDIDLPDGSGFDFCNSMNDTTRFGRTPKIFLSSYSDVSQKVFGFSCGADDYITKPFYSQEFVARIDSKLRKNVRLNNEFLYSFEFDPKFQICFSCVAGEKIDLKLTPTEYRLLYSLVKNANQSLTRRDLVRIVWKENGWNIEARGIDSHISHLRKKLMSKKDSIISVYGQGYSFKPDNIDLTSNTESLL